MDGERKLLAYCATLVTALWTSGRTRLNSRTTVMLVWLGAGAAAVQLAVGGDTLSAIVALLTGVLIGATIVVIALGVVDQGIINAQSVAGCALRLLPARAALHVPVRLPRRSVTGTSSPRGPQTGRSACTSAS